MTDRYTELVKAAYEAQQAREGDGYKSLTGQLRGYEAEMENLATLREQTVAALEAMDDAVEAAKEALDAYFAGRDEDADEPTQSDDALFDPMHPETVDYLARMEQHFPIEPLPTEEEKWDETASARGGGGLNDIPN